MKRWNRAAQARDLLAAGVSQTVVARLLQLSRQRVSKQAGWVKGASVGSDDGYALLDKEGRILKVVPQHDHHWLIERPNGPTSLGACRVCGELRDFPNAPSHMQERIDQMMPPLMNEKARAEYVARGGYLPKTYKGWNRDLVRGISGRHGAAARKANSTAPPPRGLTPESPE